LTEAKVSQKALDQLHVPRENQIATYYNIREELKMLGTQYQTYLTKPQYVVPFLQPGRIVKVWHFLYVL
jgi:ATP-dependent RNA helicase DOB1